MLSVSGDDGVCTCDGCRDQRLYCPRRSLLVSAMLWSPQVHRLSTATMRVLQHDVARSAEAVRGSRHADVQTCRQTAHPPFSTAAITAAA